MGTYQQARRAIVVGGSLAGLLAGNLLRSAGWQVDIFERSMHEMKSRGGGIILQPQLLEALRKIGCETPFDQLGIKSDFRISLSPDGSIRNQIFFPQIQTSWRMVYTTLRSKFGSDHYHRGQTLTKVNQSSLGTVRAVFSSGLHAEGSLLVGADGFESTVRRLLWPEREPTYAGYVAWHGMIRENDIPKQVRGDLIGNVCIAQNQSSYFLGYLIPGEGDDLRPGRRFYSWVWYRPVPHDLLESIMRDANGKCRGYSAPVRPLANFWKDNICRYANTLLPPQFRAVVHATHEPSVQPIRDLRVDRMIQQRVLLLGDAASTARPHTFESTSKAASDALALYSALSHFPSDIDRTLGHWERPQLALAEHLWHNGREMGDHMLLNS